MNALPLQTPGKLYRSVMPGSRMFDPDDKVMELYQQAGIQVVVVLNPLLDIREHARQDLRERYEQAGLAQIHAPVADFSAPPAGTWNSALQEVARLLRAGRRRRALPRRHRTHRHVQRLPRPGTDGAQPTGFYRMGAPIYSRCG